MKGIAMMYVFLKAHVSGYTRKDGVVVKDHQDNRSSVGEGWTMRRHADGGRTHSKMVTDGKPKFGGSGKRYMRIHELPGGDVMAESAVGYHTNHPTVEAARSHLEERK